MSCIDNIVILQPDNILSMIFESSWATHNVQIWFCFAFEWFVLDSPRNYV